MPQLRPKIEPSLLHWAILRSGKDPGDLSARFPKLHDWEAGKAKPTLKQLEAFAKATYTPIGFLFLATPPIEQVPIPDFRTVGNRFVGHPSPNLLETIYACQERQAWYREHVRINLNQPLPFVGSESVGANTVEAAARIRTVLGFDVESRRTCSRWEDALRMLIAQVDAAGIMVMVSGVVGNNNTRTLDPREFRGFALADGFAPLVFINGIDTKSAQMFTLAHEVAHIFLGETALSDSAPDHVPSDRVERWCNEVAAELLIPMDYLQGEYREGNAVADEMNRLARVFKVSTLVVLRRLLDARKITRAQFKAAYEAELERLLDLPERGGGNFYLSQGARLSKRFARAIIMDTLAGQTLFRDAQRMLGIAKMETFQELGRSLNLPI